MDALIFAAGRGTRLGELGEHTPKALIDVQGRTMLERVAERLVLAGADRIIVNIHHHADQIARFIAHTDFGAEVLVSVEAAQPLETGGALVHACDHLRRDRPFFLHNVDVITAADLRALYAAHAASDAIVTLAVNERVTPRRLLFDDEGLYGRTDDRDGTRIEVRAPRAGTREFAFAGIHVASPRLLDRITERGVFPILEPYLRLAAEGHRIAAHPLGEALWLEIGNPERLAQARAALAG